MDTNRPTHPTVFSASNQGGNNHMRTTHIIATLQSDRAARQARRQNNKAFSGQHIMTPMTGFGNGNVPPGLQARIDAAGGLAAVIARLPASLAARLQNLFGA